MTGGFIGENGEKSRKRKSFSIRLVLAVFLLLTAGTVAFSPVLAVQAFCSLDFMEKTEEPVLALEVQSGNDETVDGWEETGMESSAGITSPTMMSVVKKVNVRRGPDTSEEVLGQLEEGDFIFAVELTEEGWYRVVYGGETAYVRQDFLEIYSQEEWEEDTQDPTEIQGNNPEKISSEETSAEEKQVAGETAEDGSQREQADLNTPGQDVPESESDSKKADSTSEKEEGKKEQKGGISNLVILAVVAVVILVYAAVQIIKEKRDGGPATARKGEEAGVQSGSREGENLTFVDLEAGDGTDQKGKEQGKT